MALYRKIVIVVAIVLGIAFYGFLLSGDIAQTAFKNPTTENDYILLEENAMEVAKTLDVTSLSDETLSADFYFEENELVVTVSSKKANVTAKIPLIEQQVNAEDGTIQYSANFDFENVEYERVNLLKPPYFYIALGLLASLLIIFFVYFWFYDFWKRVKRGEYF